MTRRGEKGTRPRYPPGVKQTEKRVSPRSGFVKLTVSVRPEQYAALLAEARRRADAAGRFKLDASELVREALDLWTKPRGRTK